MPSSPVHDADESKLQEGRALCLSGGGFRAMLFHCGVIWRLNELGLLHGLARISSVSGGSITAATLGLAWRDLDFVDGVAAGLRAKVIDRLQALADHTLDAGAVLSGVFLPGVSTGDRVMQAYREHLFGDATLQDLPDETGPLFVINATNVRSGKLFRFSRPFAGDWVVGRMKDPKILLAEAVAASAAFPPLLSPVTIETSGATWIDHDGSFAHELRDRAVLSDGGLYDNLGLETAYKRYRTLLVSDAGKHLEVESDPHEDWIRHSVRVLDVIDDQVRSLRSSILVEAYQAGTRSGVYLGMSTPVSRYRAAPVVPVDDARALALARTPTRLAALRRDVQERIINHGYLICDVGLRSHAAELVPAGARAGSLPYPECPI